MSRWLAVIGAGRLALAPLASYAEGDTSDAANPSADCNLVGVRLQTDDLNGVHRICRGADGTTTVAAVEALPASAPRETEAPTQFLPLDESSAD